MARAEWSRDASNVTEGGRRWLGADRALRPAMWSPGNPEPSQVVQREFCVNHEFERRNQPERHVTAEVVLAKRLAEPSDRGSGARGGRLEHRNCKFRHRIARRSVEPLDAPGAPAAPGGVWERSRC